MTNRKYRPFRHWKELWTQEPRDQLTALRCMSTHTHIHALQFLMMERAGAEACCSLCIYVGAGDPKLKVPYFTATEPSPQSPEPCLLSRPTQFWVLQGLHPICNSPRTCTFYNICKNKYFQVLETQLAQILPLIN